MHAYVVTPFEYAGQVWPVGVHEVTEAEAYGLAIAGPVRPATSTEIEESRCTGPVIETAEAAPAVETAATRTNRRRK